MRPEDMILVSVDDHVVEPPDMFEQNVPAQWKARAPKVVKLPGGADAWTFEGQRIPNIGLNAVAGRPPEEYGVEPTSFEQLRPGCYDVDARIGDMNANGVLASMCFPSFPSFCGALFLRCEDKALSHVMLQAYNDWHIDQWCGSHPGRFIPLSLPAIWDPQLMADEVRRVAKKGCHAVSFCENPEKLGLPSLHSEHWDPFWKACSDEGTLCCIHIGSLAHQRLQLRRGPALGPPHTRVPRSAFRPLRGRHRLDPVLPRTRRLRLQAAQGLDATGLRQPAPERGLPRALHHVLHRRPGGRAPPRPDRRRHDHMGVRLPALGFDLAKGAGDLVRESLHGRTRRRDQPDHP